MKNVLVFIAMILCFGCTNKSEKSFTPDSLHSPQPKPTLKKEEAYRPSAKYMYLDTTNNAWHKAFYDRLDSAAHLNNVLTHEGDVWEQDSATLESYRIRWGRLYGLLYQTLNDELIHEVDLDYFFPDNVIRSPDKRFTAVNFAHMPSKSIDKSAMLIIADGKDVSANAWPYPLMGIDTIHSSYRVVYVFRGRESSREFQSDTDYFALYTLSKNDMAACQDLLPDYTYQLKLKYDWESGSVRYDANNNSISINIHGYAGGSESQRFLDQYIHPDEYNKTEGKRPFGDLHMFINLNTIPATIIDSLAVE